MMKISRLSLSTLVRLLVIALALLYTAGCVSSPAKNQAGPAPLVPPPGSGKILPYTHIDGFGTPTDETAWMAWEFEAQTFVKYQLVFTSCTCRQDSLNERSLLYVEIAKSEKGGKIRKVWYQYWGDSPVFPAGGNREEVEKKFVPLLVNKNMASLAKIDTITGATVTTINLKQLLAALLSYHNIQYPSPGIPDPPDIVDATSGATE